MVTETDAKKNYYDNISRKFNKCLEPTMRCSGHAIKAHSIQNANVLDILCENGHVFAFRPKQTDKGPKITMQKVGRNEATIFTGLCANHDREIFAPIDTKEFTSRDKQQLFLLAYRSLTRELHATMDAAIKIQNGYQWRVENGLDSGNEISEAGSFATTELITAWKTYGYRVDYFDINLMNGKFDCLRHNIFELDTEAASIAVSACFSLDTIEKPENRWHTAILNVFPISERKTFAIFSFSKEHSSAARKQLRHIFTSHGEKQRHEISKCPSGKKRNRVNWLR